VWHTDKQIANADHCCSCGRSNLSVVFLEILQLSSGDTLFTKLRAARHMSPSTLVRPSFHHFQSSAETTQNGRTIHRITNPTADSESGSPDSCSSFLVTICLSRLVRRYSHKTHRLTHNVDHYYSSPPPPHLVASQLIRKACTRSARVPSLTTGKQRSFSEAAGGICP